MPKSWLLTMAHPGGRILYGIRRVGSEAWFCHESKRFRTDPAQPLAEAAGPPTLWDWKLELFQDFAEPPAPGFYAVHLYRQRPGAPQGDPLRRPTPVLVEPVELVTMVAPQDFEPIDAGPDAEPGRCRGATRAGARCSRSAGGDGYCYQHKAG